MEDNYKNILANKFERETNYVIIKDTENLDELEAMWSKFNSNLTARQMRLSDDKSIELYNMTNQQHYESIKEKLFEKESKRKELENSDTDGSIDPGEVPDADMDNNGDLDLAQRYSLPNDDEIQPVSESSSTYAAREAKRFSTQSNTTIIGGENYNSLDKLEKAWSSFQSQDNDLKRKSDDKCRELFGMSNLELYNKRKATLLKEKEEVVKKEVKPSSDEDIKEFNNKLDVVKNLVTENKKHDDSFMTFVEGVYALKLLKENENKKHKRFNDTPYFTPQQMIDLGVHGNDNYYSPKPDNDGLNKTISVTTWFDTYKDMISDHIFEDYTNEWIEKMNSLFSDFDHIKECGTEEEINSRKQSILDLGWNPEIPFTNENRIMASNRVNNIIEQSVPKDIFINLDNIYDPGDDILSEAVDESTHQPVFLVLTKGKTPVVSSGIKFVTKSEYSHASISFDPELQDIYSFNMKQQNWGFVKENISSFKDNVISVFAFFIDKLNIEKMKRTVYDFANHETNFDLRIFANKILHIDRKTSNNNYKQVCSTFVDTVLQSGKVKLTDINIPSPADLYRGIKTQTNKIFEVYNGIAPKYNGKVVRRKMIFLGKDKDTIPITEACKDLKSAREFVNKVGKLASKYNANYFIVTDGASGIKNNGNPAVRNARLAQIKWENENGGDPDEDWSKTINESKDIYTKSSNQKDNLYNKAKFVYDSLTQDDKDLMMGKGSSFKNTPNIYYRKIYMDSDNKTPTGFTDLYKFPKDKDTVVLVYAVHDNFRGKGLANKIIQDTISFCKKDKNINTIIWRTDKENSASNYLAKKFDGKIIKTDETHNKYKIDTSSLLKESVDILLESVDKSKLDENHIKGKQLNLSSFKKIPINQYDKYIDYMKQDSYLKTKKGRDLCFKYNCKGYFFIDEDKEKLVAYIVVSKYKSIVPIQILPDYKNHGLAEQLMKIAINELKAEWLYVYTDNEVAIHLYEKLGFENLKTVGRQKTVDRQYAMALKGTESYDVIKPDETIKESFSIVNEVKQFPIEFDKDGNLTIYKCNTNNISYGDEIQESVELLENYRNTDNEDGLKYELARIWFIILHIEKKMKKKNIAKDKYNELVVHRGNAINIFKTNFKYLSQLDGNFNFANYYNNTPFADNGVKITSNTLKYSLSALKKLVF